jgi:molybdopterin synthase sulfur carrier subunit
MTTIRIPPVLRDATGGKRQVEATGADVRELLENLATSYPQLRERILADGELAPFVNLYIEGEDVRTRDGLDTPVHEGATLILLPAMAGGTSRSES